MLRIVVDTREQTPWHFEEGAADVRRGTLPTGDYALDGDDGFAIERKSLSDFVATVSTHWDRFQEELARMDGWPAKVIIVEGTFRDILDCNYASTMRPSFVLMRIAELTMMGVSVLMCDNQDIAAGVAWRVLKERDEQRVPDPQHQD